MKRSLIELTLFLGLGISLFTFNTSTEVVWSQDIARSGINQPGDFPNPKDAIKYHSVIAQFERKQAPAISLGNIIQQLAEQFLGAQYQAGLLDRSTQETLIISLSQFDCLLFVETVLAIANNIGQQNYGYQAFSQEIESQRYWNGRMNGYCSRLHYFSDWIADNQRRGRVENITHQLGGIDVTKKLNFMTTHRSSYPNLVSSEANFQCIAGVEQTLPTTLNYIPTPNIDQIYEHLQPGDLIGVATEIPGLDFTHTGFVYHQTNDKIGLIHASPVGKVVIAPDLQRYIANVDRAIGIVVVRAK